MQYLGQKLTVIASECGMPQYRERYAQVITLWERNIPAVVYGASDPEVRLCVCVCKTLVARP